MSSVAWPALRRVAARLALVAATGLALTTAAAGASARRDRDCADFPSQKQAQRFFERHHPRRDPHRLDADHDLTACESPLRRERDRPAAPDHFRRA